MWWCGNSTVLLSAIIWQTNAFPAGITMHTWFRIPKSGSNSAGVQDGRFLLCNWLRILSLHSTVSCCNRSSLSSGRCSSCWTVSMTIPRNSITVLDWRFYPNVETTLHTQKNIVGEVDPNLEEASSLNKSLTYTLSFPRWWGMRFVTRVPNKFTGDGLPKDKVIYKSSYCCSMHF